MMSLELAVSRVVMRARLAEQALHSDGAWTITVGDMTVLANRTILSNQIVFSALFPEAPIGGVQALDCDGVTLSVRPFVVPDFAPFIVDWAVAVIGEPVAA